MKRLAINENKTIIIRDGQSAAKEWRIAPGVEVSLMQVLRNDTPAELCVDQRFILGERSRLSVVTVSLGSGVTRSRQWVEFEEAHAEASLKALSVLGGDSQIFHQVVMNHAKPFCTSRQIFKSILLGRSRSEFDSLVHVLPDAQKSDSRQLNKNLLLSDNALAFSRPQLRIDADDVSCTHGATVGQLEEDELFYLRSRGLSQDEARYALIHGFAEEILQEIRDASLRNELEEWVQAELRQNAGVEPKC